MPNPRNPNDTETVAGVLSQLAVQLVANTDFQNDNGTVLINSDDAIYQGGIYANGNLVQPMTWPVLLIQENGQTVKRIAYRTWKIAPLQVIVFLLLPWQPQTMSLNSIWTAFGTDLRRMQANIEDNPRLVDSGGHSHVERTNQISISNRRQGSIDEQSYAFPVVKRWMELSFDLPTYTSAS
jgi:hypothetical protein